MSPSVPMIPISTYRVSPEAENLVLSVLQSGQLAQGPMVERLENLSCEMTGAKHAVAVSNGTLTLIAAMIAHGIGPGDEVITSSFTFVATLNAILFTGATAVFVDIDPETYCIDPEAIKAAVNERTKAIIPVHIFGQSADMTEIQKIASKHNLSIIEDAAQAHGAMWKDRPVGSFGTGSFSFYTTKNVGCGEGGVVTTNDADIAKTIQLLRNQGMKERYNYERVGWNFRLTDLQAAVAIPQMEKLGESNKKRNETAQQYNEAFSKVDKLVVPTIRDEAYSVWHQYSLLASEPNERDQMVEKIQNAGVSAGVYYPRPVYEYEPYVDNENVRIESSEITQSICKSVFSIPVHHYLSDGEIQKVIEVVSDVSN